MLRNLSAAFAIVTEPGQEAAAVRTDTHCPYCALQCGMTLVTDAQGTVVQSRDFPTNKGGLCQKGWTAAELIAHPERLRTPLVRDKKGEPLRYATWEEALTRTTSAIQLAQHQYGWPT